MSATPPLKYFMRAFCVFSFLCLSVAATAAAYAAPFYFKIKLRNTINNQPYLWHFWQTQQDDDYSSNVDNRRTDDNNDVVFVLPFCDLFFCYLVLLLFDVMICPLRWSSYDIH